ncbi:MAG: DivIVA domain-containing protein [Myxococcota bacterium]
MRLTPIEIRRHRFNARIRGYDREEVQTFLEMIVGDFEDIVRENAQLRRENERLSRDLESYRGKEQSIQQTMTTAQGVVDDLKQTAVKESECIVAAAEIQAEKIVREAQARKADLSNEIRQIEYVRRQAELDLRKTLEGYVSMLDTLMRQAGNASAPAEPEAKD